MAHKLENLKPFSRSYGPASSLEPKTILPRLDAPPPPLQPKVQKEVPKPRSIGSKAITPEFSSLNLTPIQVKGNAVPVGPVLSELKSTRLKVKSGRTDSSLLKSYNSLINSLNPPEPEVREPENFEETEAINPLIAEQIRLEEINLHRSESEEDPKELDKFNSEVCPRKHIVKLKEEIYPPEKNLKPERIEQSFERSSEDSERTLFSSEPILRAKEEDLDDDAIASVKISKKECKVFEYKTGKVCSYIKIRENTDNLIFLDRRDKDTHNLYAYSKQDIYNQYLGCHSQMYFHLKIKMFKSEESKDLERSSEVEIFWIPMTQIVRLLEYSHPIYEIEKTKFSINLYSLAPIKFNK